ncbi:MAG: Soluble epoxide hydrolase [Alphaproteobacteria bacterium MarineAlpha2_Bin1]|nr:MAG: Soluble epoxide hydrolase [Alphaproteobacteria bacterium MarineAlpha2_Bin1]
MNINKGYVKTKFGQIHYRFCGNGKPIVLLHPSPRSSVVYEKLMMSLGETHQVYAPDTLGFGYSDPLPRKFDFYDLADSIYEFLKYFSLNEVTIFGLHTGNKIAAAIGHKNYNCIKNLILCGMSHSLILDKNIRNTQIHKIVNKNSEVDIYGNRWKKTYELIYNSWWTEKILNNNNLKVKDFKFAENEVIDFIKSRESYESIYNENYIFDFEEAVKNITIPVLIIELISEREKDIGNQSNSFKSIGSNFHTCQLKKSFTGILSDEGRSNDVLETKVNLLSKKIIDFNKNYIL